MSLLRCNSQSHNMPGQKQLYIAFDSTTDAIACKDLLTTEGVEGRLVSVPREISAGCGYAWRSPLNARPRIKALLENADFDFAGIWEI
ncbi:MAG: DUF3343 domain-containing protein [Coriobacteriales bacterium]|nr:DUF3343 domain-containing protein [Coriobacteriales bacterium]